VITLTKAWKWIVGLVLAFAMVAAAGYTYHSVTAQSGGQTSNTSQAGGDGHPLP